MIMIMTMIQDIEMINYRTRIRSGDCSGGVDQVDAPGAGGVRDDTLTLIK